MENTFVLIQSQAESFFNQLKLNLLELGISTDAMLFDHLCYRVETWAEYDYYKKIFQENGSLLIEADINGRPIATYQFNKAMVFDGHEIDVIELPAPKTDRPYKTGFEHAEVVIRESFEDFELKYPKLNFQRSNMSGLNPELTLKLKSGQVKFHHQPLKKIIEIEKSQMTDIVFDLDSTLVQSRHCIYQINQEVFSTLLEREISIEEIKEKFYPEFPKLFEVFQITCETKKKQAVDLWAESSKKFSHPVYAGAVDLLSDLKTKGFRLHLWTARDEDSAMHILTEHNLRPHFSTLSFSSLTSTKPKTEALNFDWASIKPGKCMMVGDSLTDMRGAKNIQALAAAALWDTHLSKTELLQGGADLCFHNLADLGNWLLRSR